MSSSIHNVQRIERGISIATGAAAIASGVYQGGSAGLIKALGGLALVHRGISGHCSLKAMIIDPHAELVYLRQRVADLRAAVDKLEKNTSSGKRAQEAKVDHALEETFPASDPISP